MSHSFGCNPQFANSICIYHECTNSHMSPNLSLNVDAPRTPGGPRPAGLTMDSATLDQFSAPQGGAEARPAGGAGAPGRRPRGPKPRLAGPVFPKLPGLTKRLGDLLGRRSEAKEEGRSMGQRSVSASSSSSSSLSASTSLHHHHHYHHHHPILDTRISVLRL